MKISTKGLEQNGEVSPLVAEFLRQQNEGRMITTPIPKSLDNPLGVSVWHLMTTFKRDTDKYIEELFKEEEKDPSDAVIYDIENLQKDTGFIRQKGENVECEDGKLGESYVNCLEGKDNVGPATHMLSYSWGNKIYHIISSLYSHCFTNDLDPKRTYIWICCLCINQHHVKAMMERGEDVPFEQFGIVFQERVVKIGNVLALMVPWKKPIYLTRVWCIYETYTALIEECNLSIIMPKEEKIDLMGAIEDDAHGHVLYNVLAATHIENATASVPSDKENILRLIESGAGYSEVNNKVNSRLREWIYDTIVEMIEGAEESSNNVTTDTNLALFYNKIGIVYGNNGQYDVALDYYKKSLSIYENVHGDEHEDTATGYYTVGHAYKKLGKYDDALEYFTKTLSIEKKMIGKEEDSSIGSTYRAIGNCYRIKKEFKTALATYEESLSICKKIHGEMHQETATTLNNMALCYDEIGERDVALQNYFESLRIKESIFEEGHPSIATTYQNIGAVYYKMNNLIDSEKYVIMAIDIQTKVLGPDHPSTMDSKAWYGKILVELRE